MNSENGERREYGSAAGGLGPLFSGLIAAALIALTLLVAVALGMGEQKMLAQVEPTMTPTATPRVVPSSSPTPVPTFTEEPSSTPTATSSATAIPAAPATATPTTRPTRTPRPTIVRATPTTCVVNPWGWDDRYTVQSGDWLAKIARATGTTTANLITANCLTSNTIHAGQTLWVPSLPATPRPTIPAPVIKTFVLDPDDQVIVGECVEIDWVVEGDVDSLSLLARTDSASTETLVSDAPKTGTHSDCPTEAGTRQYTLKAVGPDSASSETRTITVIDDSEAPVAAFTYACTELSCSFDGSGSHDPDGTIVSYEWDFGDGETGSGATASHEYASDGTYTVRLTVTDDEGDTDTDSQNVTVSGGAVNQEPVASFTYDCAELSCSFDGSGSNDSDGTIVSYEWAFGDGAIGSGATASHEYAADGTYSVSLTVTDDEGDTDTVSQSVTVSMPNQSPVADFTYDCADLSCSFDGMGSYDPDGTIASYEWAFGDGATGSGATASHEYTADGSYTVRLTVTDDDGDTGTVSQNVAVSASSGAESRGFVFSAIAVTPRFIALMAVQEQSLPT